MCIMIGKNNFGFLLLINHTSSYSSNLFKYNRSGGYIIELINPNMLKMTDLLA